MNGATSNLSRGIWAAAVAFALVSGWATGKALRDTPARNAERQTGPAATAGAPSSSGAQPKDTHEHSEVFKRLHLALGIQDSGKRERAIASLADNLNAAQIREALERLATSRIPFRKEAMAQLFARWGEIEPLAAMEFALGLRKVTDRSDAVGAVLDGWMEHDPVAAEKWVNLLPDGPVKSGALRALITNYAVTDRNRAITLAERTQLAGQTEAFAQAIFANWALDDPQAAATRATQISEGWFRTEALSVIAKQWAEAAPEQAINWATSLPDRITPERADEAASTTMSGADRTNTARNILAVWLKVDGDAVVRWFQELPDDVWKINMIASVYERNADTSLNARTAVELMGQLPEGEMRNGMISGVAERIAQFTPKSGLAMLSYETDQHSRLMIMSGLANELKGDELLEALRQVDCAGASSGTFWRWADPETAARWAAQQPNATSYLCGSATAWMNNNPDTAEPFIRALPIAQRDGVVSQMVQDSLYRRFPATRETVANYERMGQWIPEIVDPSVRETAYRKLAKRWLEVDAASGRRWVEGSPIPGAVKGELLKVSSNTK